MSESTGFCVVTAHQDFRFSNESQTHWEFSEAAVIAVEESIAVIFVVVSAAMGQCNTPGANEIVRLTEKTGTLDHVLNSSVPSDDVKCITWIITVPEGHVVKLRIIAFWYLDRACKNSTLQIRDGPNSTSEAFESLCGLGKDELVTLFSSDRHLWVQLQYSNDHKAEIYAVFEAVKQCKVFRLPVIRLCTLYYARI